MAGSIPDEVPGPEAELANRELVESDRVRETEYQAVLRELSVKDVYVRESELNLARSENNLTRSENKERATRDELAQVRARAAELFVNLERAEAVIAGLNDEIARLQDEIATIHATRSYRWSVTAASFANRLASPLRRETRGGGDSEPS